MATEAPALDLEPRISWQPLLRALAIGVAFDLAALYQKPGVSIPIFFVVAMLLLRDGIRRSVQDDVLLASAVVLSSFCVVRASGPVLALDVMAALALFGIVAASDPRSAMRAGLLDALRVLERLMVAVLGVPVFLTRPMVRSWQRTDLGRARPVLRAIAIAVPVLVVFAALLGSADRVFGNLLVPDLNVDAGSVVLHAVAIGFGAICAAVVLLAASLRERASNVSLDFARPRLGFTEWTIVLGGIDLLFAGFVAVQFAVLFGGRHQVEVTPGLTYAQYARSGFFQLIAVAVLTVLVIVAVWDLGERANRAQERTFRWLVGAMAGCTMVILVSALKRLVLYQGAFGWTLARLGAAIVIALIGYVLLALLGTIWLGARRRLVSLALVGGLVALLALNLINPERFVAERNLARYEATQRIDVGYLGYVLGADAVPVMIRALDRVNTADARDLRQLLCVQFDRVGAREPSVRSYNAARAEARRALARAGITARTCPDR